jgi:inner membrane protein
MATPYGHTLAGLSLLNFWYPQADFSKQRAGLVYGLVVLGASLPDLDFIPGLILGQGGRFHHGYTHSLGLAIVVSLVAGGLIKWVRPGLTFIKAGGFFCCLVLSHLFLDFLTEAPKGFPLFWPFTENNFWSTIPIFPRVERNWGNPDLWNQGLYCLLVESFLLLPLWVSSWRKRSYPD